VDTERLLTLLTDVRAGGLSVEDAARRLSDLPLCDLGHTQVDTHRALRCGHAEVVFGAGKTPGQLVEVARTILEHHDRLLVTRATPEGAAALVAEVPAAVHHELSGAVTVEPQGGPEGEGDVLIVSAGTSDGPVAEEAAVTARMLGARVEELRDVGVAGLHRLLAQTERIRAAAVLVVVAGMEGALPSVVGGLVDAPVIAVPTSVGYGASFGGVAALLGMLNSCAAGVTVVNIDNGFGAGFAAAKINRLAVRPGANRA
jgi:NCAIR mutase (PurE)-related protein